jgi:hypothetical protein
VIPFVTLIGVDVVSILSIVIVFETIWLCIKYLCYGFYNAVCKIINWSRFGMNYLFYYISQFIIAFLKTSIKICSLLLRIMAVVGCICICLLTYIIIENGKYDYERLMGLVLVLSVASVSIASVSVLIMSRIPKFIVRAPSWQRYTKSFKGSKKYSKSSKQNRK